MAWKVLDVLLELTHIIVILFNLIGWLFPKTRFVHWISVNITAFSWLVLGFFYGFGYCFLTDWHWQIKAKLGNIPNENSFITYLLHKVGLSVSENIVDVITAVIFVIVFIISWIMNFHRLRQLKPLKH